MLTCQPDGDERSCPWMIAHDPVIYMSRLIVGLTRQDLVCTVPDLPIVLLTGESIIHYFCRNPLLCCSDGKAELPRFAFRNGRLARHTRQEQGRTFSVSQGST